MAPGNPSFIKTTKLPFSWRRTVSILVERYPSTSTSVISLSPDRIAKGDVKVEWCPTEDMTGDYWTKPLQGALFKRFRDLIMGVMPNLSPEVPSLARQRGRVRTLIKPKPNQMSAGVCWRTKISPHPALKDLKTGHRPVMPPCSMDCPCCSLLLHC